MKQWGISFWKSLLTFATQVRASALRGRGARVLSKDIETATRSLFTEKRRTFRELHATQEVRPPSSLAAFRTTALVALAVCACYLVVAWICSERATSTLAPNEQVGSTLLSYAEICSGMVGLLFAVFVFSAERAVDRLGHCAFLLGYVIRRSRALECCGVSIGIIVALAISGLLAGFKDFQEFAAGSLSIAIPSLLLVVISTLYLLRQALDLARADDMLATLGADLARTHVQQLAFLGHNAKLRENFASVFEVAGGIYTPYGLILYGEVDPIEITLPSDCQFYDFDLVGFAKLLVKLKAIWPKGTLVITHLVGDSWTGRSKCFLVPGKPREVTSATIDSRVRDSLADETSRLFILRKLKQFNERPSDLNRVVGSLPHIARDESSESFIQVLEMLRHCIDAEPADRAPGAPGRLLDWWTNRGWRDVDDAVLEAPSRSKLEAYWSFLEWIKYTASAKRDSQQVGQILVMHRGLIWTALRAKSAFVDWIADQVDDSLSSPFLISGITTYGSSPREGLSENATSLEVQYIKHCVSLVHSFHQFGRERDALNTLDRLLDRHSEIMERTGRSNREIPVDVRRFLTLGLIYLLGWAIWKLDQGEDSTATEFVKMIPRIPFETSDVIDTWCHLGGLPDGAGLVDNPSSWERKEETRTGKVYTSSGAQFPRLGFLAALLISQPGFNSKLKLEANKLHLIEKKVIEDGQLQISGMVRVSPLLEAKNNCPLSDKNAEIQKFLEPFRRAAMVRDIQSVLDRDVPYAAFEVASRTVRDKLSSAFEASALMQRASTIARAKHVEARHASANLNFYLHISKADLLSDNMNPESAAEHLIYKPQDVFSAIVARELARAHQTATPINPDDEGRDVLRKALVAVRERGCTPIAIVHDNDWDDLAWLGGPNYWVNRGRTFEPYEQTRFDGLPVIFLPEWRENHVLILTDQHFVPVDSPNVQVSVKWAGNNAKIVSEKLSEAVKAGTDIPLPHRMSIRYTLHVELTCPFAIASGGDGILFSLPEGVEEAAGAAHHPVAPSASPS